LYDLNKLPQVADSLDIFERYCAITVALKIADDTCKMDEYEKSIFMALYDLMQVQQSDFFNDTIFELIEQGRKTPSAQIYSKIKTLRQDAMEMITQPRMKAFKASVRGRLT
jgi:hypothetical protein